MNEKWENAKKKLLGYKNERNDYTKIRFAEGWLDAHFDALCENNQVGKAVDALGRYERLCDDFRHDYGRWEWQSNRGNGGSR